MTLSILLAILFYKIICLLQFPVYNQASKNIDDD